MGLSVFITLGEAVSSACGNELGRHAWITLVEGKGPLCLSCADVELF